MAPPPLLLSHHNLTLTFPSKTTPHSLSSISQRFSPPHRRHSHCHSPPSKNCHHQVRKLRPIPRSYVIALLSDPAAIMQCAALETLCDILPLIRDIPSSDAKIFLEYILPTLSMLSDDPEESVRIYYASNIAKLALTAYGFFIRLTRLSEDGVLDELTTPKTPGSSNEMSQQCNIFNNDAQLA